MYAQSAHDVTPVTLARLHRRIYKATRRFMGVNQMMREDALGVALCKAVERDVRAETWEAWVVQIARNWLYDCALLGKADGKTMRKHYPVHVFDEENELYVQERDTLDSLCSTEDHEALHRAMAQLPPRDQAVLRARYWDNEPQEVTAARLGMSHGAVRQAVLRARTQLRTIMISLGAGQ